MGSYYQWINNERYEVHQFWISLSLNHHQKVLKNYFKVMDMANIPYRYKRRKIPLEYGEAAVMILARIDQLLDLDIPIAAGSRYLSSQPWALFGESSVSAKIHFRDMEDIANKYRPERASTTSEYFHFRKVPYLVEQLANKYVVTPNFIMNVAIGLLYDIVCHCGPDCPELADIFSNDIRTSKVKISYWQEVRCKVMGRYGKILDIPFSYKLGQVDTSIPLKSQVAFEFVGSDISKGVKLIPFVDDDVAYASRVNDRIEKLSHLGIYL